MQPTPPIASGNHRCAAACGVHQDVAHGHARHGQEMGPVLPGGASLVHQPEIGLVHQSGGVKRLTRTPAAELPVSHGAQLVIDQRHQPVHGAPVPLADGCQKLSYLSRDRTLRALRHLFLRFPQSPGFQQVTSRPTRFQLAALRRVSAFSTDSRSSR
jgi:hypothetical protein